MKPRTAREKEAVALSAKLPKLTKAQEEWAMTKVGPFVSYDHYGEQWCSQCGHIWQNGDFLLYDVSDNRCPRCGAELERKTSRKIILSERYYFTIIAKVGEWQVLRHFLLEVDGRRDTCQFSKMYHEAVQCWMKADGQRVIIARNRKGLFSRYNDLWDFTKPMSYKSTISFWRTPQGQYQYCPDGEYVYPRYSLIPILKRNGFRSMQMSLPQSEMMAMLIQDGFAEQMMKNKQKALLAFYWKQDGFVRFTPKQVGQAFKRKYKFKNTAIVATWNDHISLLSNLGKDTNNPNLYLPSNLEEMHRVMVEAENARRRKIEEAEKQRKLERKKLEAFAAEEQYKEQKAKFFGLAISDGEIKLHVLQNIQEFIDEADEMHHCVFECEYYKKANSLILSATIDGKRIETVEVDLKTFEVEQSRGKYNQDTPYHQKIVQLVKSNMDAIRKAAS